MQDQPTPTEILAAVARFLKETVAAETTGHTSFTARVAANALEMMGRQLTLAPTAEAEEQTRLEAILNASGDLPALNAELARRIAAGDLDPTDPPVADHLWTTTLAKLAVDQPNYWGYRAALAERAEPSPSSPVAKTTGEEDPKGVEGAAAALLQGGAT
jgi:hypothetical protein